MKQGGGRLKGNLFERTVAEMVIKAGEHYGFRKKDCYRTPRSGGHAYAKKENPSDLVLSKRVRKILPISVECKSIKKLDLQNIWTKEGPMFSWIDQAKSEAGKWHPVVVFKWNRSVIFCIFPDFCKSCRDCIACVPPIKGAQTRFIYKNQKYTMCRFTSFLKQVIRERGTREGY